MATSQSSPNAGRRDLFLSYNSTNRDTVVSVRQALNLRNISAFYDRADLNPGQPWFDELEAALRQVRGVAVFVGREGLGTIQKREMQFALARQATEEKAGRRFPVIPVLLEGADPEAISGFLALNTWVDLRRQLEDAGALDAFVKALGPQTPETPAEVAAAICPFRGLNAFREEDAALFFGREAFSQRLLAHVLKRNLVAVIGRSGSGKSSVVQAGLLPLLRRQRPPDETWESVIFSPGSKPFHRLAAQLVPLWSAPGRDQTDIGTESEKLGSRLADGEVKLAGFVDLALKHLPNTSRLLIIVDQFEELFTQTPQPDQSQRFVEQLLNANRESNLTVVLTLRADFYGQAIKLRDLSEAIETGVVNVSEMTRAELKEAIEEPVKRTGPQFEAGLVDRILDRVREQPGSLPLLEFALTELWQQRQSGQLTHAAYDAIGGVEGAISKRAQTQFAKLTPAQQEIALPALSRLVRVSSASEEATDTRQVIRLQELEPDAQAVMLIFAAKEARLVVTGRDETSDAETVQVAHEALIRGWGELRHWIDKDREFLLWRQQLRPFLDKWRGLTQDKDAALLQGVYLTEARRWMRERGKDLNTEERQFIEASERPTIRFQRLKRFAAAAVAVTALAACVYFWWTRRDIYQVQAVFATSPRMLASATQFPAEQWLEILVRIGRAGDALADGQRIDSASDRAEALADLATVLSESGRSQEASEAATRALAALGSVEPMLKQTTTCGVAKALIRVGKTREAVSATLAITNANIMQRCFEGMARELVNAGRAGEVSSLVLAVQDPDTRNTAILNVLRPLAEKGQVAVAQELAGRMQNPAWKPYTTAAVAEALAEAGKTEQASKVAQEALGMARAEKNGSLRSNFLGSAAYALIVAGRTSDALAIAPEIVDRDARDQVLGWTAEKLAKSGHAEDAIAVAKQIQNPEMRGVAFESVVKALAGTGMTQGVVDTMALVIKEGYSWRPAGLAEIVGALAGAGKPEDALVVARQVGDPAGRGGALVNASQALARAGKRTEAETAAVEALPGVRQITDPSSRADDLIIVMEVLGKVGTSSQAKDAAREAVAAAGAITDNNQRSDAFSRLASAYAKLHSYRQARLAADLCNSSDDKLTAYAVVVREYSIQHHPELAKSFSDDSD
jgi:tetratricopeptide (TPR) repeat protein